MQAFHISAETRDALYSLKGRTLASIAADFIHIYEDRDFIGCGEIGFRDDQLRLVTSFQTNWKTVGHDDIHLFDVTPESQSRIPRSTSANGVFSVGPCSWIEMTPDSTISAVEIAELEVTDSEIIYDWGIVIHTLSGRRVSFATQNSSILGEIEIRLSGELRAPEYGDCALHLKTLFN